MKKFLLVNLPFERIYEGTKLVKMAPSIPPLSLSVIGASLLKDNHEVKIFDFNLPESNTESFKNLIILYKPDFVGITFVTPLVPEMKRIVKLIKNINPKIIVIGGGPHCSSYPKETIKESLLDIAVIGEGDNTIREIAKGIPLKKIEGIAFRKKNAVEITKPGDPIIDLDSLPYPAYDLYDYNRYRILKTIARNQPVAWMETSRGCVYNCVYCNKNIFGRCFRKKSPERVVKEMIRLKKMGVKELHFTDDAFTTDMQRAKKICEILIKEKVGISWALVTGIRVNQVDPELLFKMKKAGCYKLFFGIESGNQTILNNIKKGITLQQVRDAVKMAKAAGIEVWGAFMIGLPGETEQTMIDTINFAKSLPLDLAKMSILIPLPATPLFNEWDGAGYIKTHNWEDFSFYNAPTKVYNHPTLSWELITQYYNRFYKEFYFRPRFILQRFISSIKERRIIDDAKILLGTNWFK